MWISQREWKQCGDQHMLKMEICTDEKDRSKWGGPLILQEHNDDMKTKQNVKKTKNKLIEIIKN